MDLFEYQGKQMLRALGVATPDGGYADTADEARGVAERLANLAVAVKAQVQVGGRGKAGGIKVAADPDEAYRHAESILGMDIKGHIVERIWLEPAAEIDKEFYASFTIDRSAKCYLGMVSSKGGVDIEEVAATDPDAIAKVRIDPLVGLRDYHLRRLVFDGGIPAVDRKGVMAVLRPLYKAFVALDAELVEVNPLIVDVDGNVIALDAKVTLDDNAEYRIEGWEELSQSSISDPQEAMAAERGLNYIKLDGEVGIIGNGAGLVMSTLDVVAQAGGRAANFLDVGGGAKAKLIADSLEVIASDPNVRSILINIFGGITRGEEVAQGIVDALDAVDISQPIVVRLDGTNAAEGRKILENNPRANLESSPTMLDAASRAVALAGNE